MKNTKQENIEQNYTRRKDKMLLTGNIVLNDERPYMYLLLDEETAIEALVAIKYSPKGWVFAVDNSEDIVFDFNPNTCRVLKDCTDTMDELCKAIGKYYEAYEIASSSHYDALEAEEEMNKACEQMYTCNPKQVIPARKRWLKKKVAYTKANTRYEKDKKASESKLASLSKNYNNDLIESAQQLEIDFEDRTVVEYKSKKYRVMNVDSEGGYADVVYLFTEEKPADLLEVNKGEYFKAENQEEVDLTGDVVDKIKDYAKALFAKRTALLKLNVDKSLLEIHKEAIKTEADRDLIVYREGYDHLRSSIISDHETVESAQKAIDSARFKLYDSLNPEV